MPDILVHPTAVIDDGAVIGAGTRIWHFCHVMSGAVIGRDCVLGHNVFVGRGVRIGDGCKLENNVSLFEGVELDAGVFCGPSVVFTNVRTPRAHVDRHGEFLPTLVGRGATLGANSTIVCGIRIGAFATVGAGSVVTKSVPDYALCYGNPAKQAGWMCECGERLDLTEDAMQCRRCGSRYAQTGER